MNNEEMSDEKEKQWQDEADRSWCDRGDNVDAYSYAEGYLAGRKAGEEDRKGVLGE